MRFSSLSIKNFRAIRNFEVNNLTDFVLIAGPNGCGKSCVFDAIRLLKSVYGGYQANEWMQWFGEFQINLNDSHQIQRMLRDPNRPVEMAAQIQLAQHEKDFLRANAEAILTPLVWARVTNQPIDAYNASSIAVATQFRQFGDIVRQQVESSATELRDSVDAPDFPLALTIATDGSLAPVPNQTMEVVFQTYLPEHLGIIEYHSASRSYAREVIQPINLDIKQLDTQRRQHTLYNWQQKYSNVKTELAATFIRDLIAKESGVTGGESDLNATLKELFQTFFPEKQYLGVRPDPTGGLDFPVRTRGGQEHDINDLSSGEKEVLYGYLKLRNSTPRFSTILLDEPELHLNPALLRGFPDFYHKHLGRARDNQLWLVTHSDTLLRQGVGNSNYSVFHMTLADADERSDNQALEVLADDDLEQATIDLVGDLATYQPQGKVVLFEGGGDTEIDVLIMQRLFPTFAKRVNLVSGGSKRRVRDLYEVLAETAEKVGMAKRFFAITDKDSGPWEVPPPGAHQLVWDVYHVENYLLESKYVREAVLALTTRDAFNSDEEVRQALHSAAEKLLPNLVIEQLRKEINDRIVSAVRLGADPTKRPAEALLASIEGTFSRLEDVQNTIGDAFLATEAREIENRLRCSLADNTWLREFPGRLILKRFVDDRLAGKANYEAFRNIILDQMVDGNYEPPGMRSVVDTILGEDPNTSQGD
jgi:energy-coupling factor transporter ATP-binding protein EcfA2